MDKQKKTPILFTLYEPETGEVRGEYSAFIVPFGILEVAAELAAAIDLEKPTGDDMKAIAGMIVELYGHRFEVDDVRKYADMGEALAVLNAIMTRAGIAMPKGNPTRPE